MDADKIGKFIKNLREEKGWNQLELSKKLYITQQAISSWENGKSIPDIEKLKLLLDLFNVNIEDLYAGERINNTHQKNEVIYNIVKNEHQKLKKSFLIFSIIVILIICIFLIYYFINSYKSIKVYLISTDEEKINVDGLMITSKDKTYFQLVVENLNVKEVILLYRENEIYKTEDNNINFKDGYGYNEFLSYNSLKDVVDNLHLNIIDIDNNFYDVKLILSKDFENSQLIFNPDDNIIEEDSTQLKETNIPQKIISSFENKDGNYELVLNKDNTKISIWYLTKTDQFWVTETKNKIIKEWDFYILEDKIYFQELDSNMEVQKSFNNNEHLNEKENEEIEYFIENYVKKYLK